jgi:predicted TPR repeat methyltransferase
VVCQRLQDWQGEQLYDGIWANAVLLHLTKGECRKFLGRVGDCLAPEGIFYFSLKCGIVTGMDGEGRYFANYSPQEIRQLVQGSGLNLLELWESGDLLQRQGFCWVNVLAKK